ncbi:MAG: trehalose-phosphatase [Alphaproteobacteria bacterium]|nr:trehalose-phosphatase [Alphaproteobacteria bacterium]
MDGRVDSSPPSPALPAPPPLTLSEDALFLDLDGTLVAIAEHPDAIALDPGLAPLLTALRTALNGRLAIVSGRMIADLDRHLGEAARIAAGIHGLERRGADGTIRRADASDVLAIARGRLSALAAQHAGLLLEDKGLALALHYRGAPSLGPELRHAADAIASEAEGALAVQPGHMVLEVKPAGITKGDAVAAFLAEPPFAGARPIFIGDDLTDEHGFEACAAHGGFGILVGPARASAARYGLKDPRAVLRFLAAGLPEVSRA